MDETAMMNRLMYQKWDNDLFLLSNFIVDVENFADCACVIAIGTSINVDLLNAHTNKQGDDFVCC